MASKGQQNFIVAVILVAFLGAVGGIMALAAYVNSSPATPHPTPTTLIGVTVEERQACADEAVRQFPGDQNQQQFFMALCLRTQAIHESQASDLVDGN